MNRDPQLEAAAAAFRTAVERQDFAAAEISARRYGELARAAMAGLPPVLAEARMTEATRLLESARRKICLARAKIAGRVERLTRVAVYLAPAPAEHTWSVDA